ncbi:unnamed protein product [Gadus morhua 'NCC']
MGGHHCQGPGPRRERTRFTQGAGPPGVPAADHRRQAGREGLGAWLQAGESCSVFHRHPLQRSMSDAQKH